jgi:hypothetical protein
MQHILLHMSVAGCDALGQAFLCQTNTDILSLIPLHAEDFVLKFVCEIIISAYMVADSVIMSYV